MNTSPLSASRGVLAGLCYPRLMKMPQLMRDRYHLIREVVFSALRTKASLAERRRMAEFLHALADELAEPRSPGPGNSAPGEGIRWTGRHLILGRALWRAIGEPHQVAAEVNGTTTRLRADPDGELHVVVNPNGSLTSGVIPYGSMRNGLRAGDLAAC